MNQQYSRFIVEKINEIQDGIPFLSEEITEMVVNQFNIEKEQARKIVNTNLNRLNGDLIENYKKGIYYKPKVTVFGKSPLNPSQLINKLYIEHDQEVIGYETGVSLVHKMGLSSHLPKYKYIATNTAYHQRGNKILPDLKIVLRRPNTMVTKNNYLYLQVIDAIENKDSTLIDASQPYKLINEFIVDHNLDFAKLVAIASKYYSKEVVFRIGKLAEKIIL